MIEEARNMISEERIRVAVAFFVKENPNCVSFKSYVYVNGKRYDFSIKRCVEGEANEGTD